MSGINFKTKGDTTPRGKQKIWIAMHPADYSSAAFDSIVKSVLDKHDNCAVFFEEFSHKNKREILSAIKQAQLFILIVSKNTLTTPNDAIDVQFKFAINNNIPVLPIVIEKNLERLFAKKCGSIQYLDQCCEDPTAISYNEKLAKFLSSVLLGDEEIKAIKNAFDAMIFLSYRKKDREYAQELIRLIRKNDLFRDVAIWYDEYLIPAEAFDKQIETELKASDVFLLSVSPTISSKTLDDDGNESDNYVVRAEYPLAQKLKKPIIAATTNTKIVKNLDLKPFSELPPSLDANDTDNLCAVLSEAFTRSPIHKHIALRTHDSDPEHVFFIGLAYLNGINVEPDYQKAIDLITQAAHSGLPEAMRKLIFCYHNGQGVERNFLTEIVWREALTKHFLNKYEESKTEKHAFEYGNELLELGDAYHQVLRKTDASKCEAIYKQLNAFCHQEQHLQKSINVRRLLFASLQRLGKISYGRQNYTDAQQYINEALQIATALSLASPKNKIIQEDLAVAYFWMGKLSSCDGNLEQAKTFFAKEITLRKKIDKPFVTKEDVLEAGVGYRELFYIANKQGDEKLEKKYLSKMMETLESMLKMETEEETIDFYDSVAHQCVINNQYSQAAYFYLDCANLCLKSKDVSKADRYYALSIDYANRIDISKAGIEELGMISKVYVAYVFHLKEKAYYHPLGLRISYKFIQWCIKRIGLKDDYDEVADFFTDYHKKTGRNIPFLEKSLKRYGLIDGTGNSLKAQFHAGIIEENERYKVWEAYFRKTERVLLKLTRNGEREADLKSLGEFYYKVSNKVCGKLRKKTAIKSMKAFLRLKKKFPENTAYEKFVVELQKLI